MFSRASKFVVHVADLAEAEGRMLREVGEQVVKRLILWTIAAVVAVVALGFLAAGLIWLLAWLVTWPVALILVAGLLFGGVVLLLKLAAGREPGTLEPAASEPPGPIAATPGGPPPATPDPRGPQPGGRVAGHPSGWVDAGNPATSL